MTCIPSAPMVLRTRKMILRTGNSQEGLGFRVHGLRSTKKASWIYLILTPYPLHPKKGLTLIEILITVSILAIGIIGVLQAFAGSLAALEVGQNNISAVNVMKQKISDVEGMLLEQKELPSGSESGIINDFKWQWEIKPTGTEYLNELTLMVSHAYNPRTFLLKS